LICQKGIKWKLKNLKVKKLLKYKNKIQNIPIEKLDLSNFGYNKEEIKLIKKEWKFTDWVI